MVARRLNKRWMKGGVRREMVGWVTRGLGYDPTVEGRS